MRPELPPTAAPTIDDIREAAARIRPHVHRTPVLTCTALDRQVGAQVYLKCENLQKAGAFKFRGACNAVFAQRGRSGTQRGHPFLRQPCPSPGPGRPAARHPRLYRHAP